MSLSRDRLATSSCSSDHVLNVQLFSHFQVYTNYLVSIKLQESTTPKETSSEHFMSAESSFILCVGKEGSTKDGSVH